MTKLALVYSRHKGPSPTNLHASFSSQTFDRLAANVPQDSGHPRQTLGAATHSILQHVYLTPSQALGQTEHKKHSKQKSRNMEFHISNCQYIVVMDVSVESISAGHH